MLGIELDGRRATGVRYRQNGAPRTAQARREIVLAAGAINSPQILQVSGIGPGAHLQAQGVEVAHDLPGVGHNLQDHFQARSVYRCTRPITLNDRVRSPFSEAAHGRGMGPVPDRPAHHRRGSGCDLSRAPRPERESPDVQFHIILFSADRPGQPLHRFPGFTLRLPAPAPRAAARCWIGSPRAEAAPARSEPNYLAAETDRRCMVDGLKLGPGA